MSLRSGRQAQGSRRSGPWVFAICRTGVRTSCRRCTPRPPPVHAPSPAGARISFAAKLTKFAAKSYHIWRQIYGIMAANLYETRKSTRRPRASKSHNARNKEEKHMKLSGGQTPRNPTVSRRSQWMPPTTRHVRSLFGGPLDRTNSKPPEARGVVIH